MLLAARPSGRQGRARVRIGAETSEELDYRPASLFVVERVRRTYACTVCSRAADPADDPVPTIATAPLPAQSIGKGLPGPGLLVRVVVSKFADHLPLHRQHGILARRDGEVRIAYPIAIVAACKPIANGPLDAEPVSRN